MINFGEVPAGAVLPIPFAAYAAATGASVTLTGLAVTDIEVYKGTSMTQRASDAGYALMDTDGIDIDGITGIHGFSIDTGDNTDASFYSVGSYFTVVVSAVTIDSQTVNFIAATFRLRAAEAVAGVPKADATHVAGTAQTAGDIFARLGAPAGASMSADIAAVKSQTAAIETDTGTDLPATLSTIAGYLDTEIAAIKAKTDNLPASPAAVGSAMTLTSGERDAVADAMLDRNMATGTDSGSPTVRTVRQALRFLRNKWSISGTALTVTKEDDATASWTSTVTATAGADPITGNDPA